MTATNGGLTITHHSVHARTHKIKRCIQIPIMDHAARGARPRPIRQTQHLIDVSTTAARLTAGKPLKSKLPTLWTRSYYVETIGHISEDVIKRYIEDQKNK